MAPRAEGNILLKKLARKDANHGDGRGGGRRERREGERGDCELHCFLAPITASEFDNPLLSGLSGKTNNLFTKGFSNKSKDFIQQPENLICAINPS